MTAQWITGSSFHTYTPCVLIWPTACCCTVWDGSGQGSVRGYVDLPSAADPDNVHFRSIFQVARDSISSIVHRGFYALFSCYRYVRCNENTLFLILLHEVPTGDLIDHLVSNNDS